MPRYYHHAGMPRLYEAEWPGWPLPAAQPAYASTLTGDLYGSLGDGGTGEPTPVASRKADGGALALLFSPTVRTIAAGAMAYHGYKRTSSGWWALLWSVFGGSMPVVAVPISVAQGFGKKKLRKNPSKKKRITTLATYVPKSRKKKLAKKKRLRTAAGRRRSDAAKRGWKKRRKKKKKRGS